MKRTYRLSGSLLIMVLITTLLCPTALADTDSNSPKITQQPDQLVLQLGARWAGVEFELRTDAGVFPVPVVVDESGVLTMDLGGSTTYTLTCINSTTPIPDPNPDQGTQAQEPDSITDEQPDTDTIPQAQAGRVSPVYLIVFFVGLACAVVGLVALYTARRRGRHSYDEWAIEEDEPYN